MYGCCGLWEEPVRSCGNANQGWETTRPRSEVILAADKNYDDARCRDNDHVQPLLGDHDLMMVMIIVALGNGDV